MTGCLLVPLDGSTLSKRALPYAIGLTKASGGTLLLLRVLIPRPPRGEPLVQESAAMAELDEIAGPLRAQGLSVDAEVSSTIFGGVAEVIVDTAQRSGAELIVMSTHGRSGFGRWVYGSVAERVLRLSATPVLLVPAPCGRGWPSDRRPRMLLALDGSALAALAVAPTQSWAQLLGADVHLIRALPPVSSDAAAYVYEDRIGERAEAMRTLESVASSFRQAGVQTAIHTPTGEAAACIAQLAAEQDIDILAMATHGRSGVPQVVLGGVATETLHRTGLPTLLVRAAGPVQGPHPSSEPEHEQVAQRVKLLVALDLTERADAVLPVVARLATVADADVVLLNVFMPSVELGRVFTDSREAGLSYVTAERRMFLERKAEELRGVRVSVRVQSLPHGEEIDEGIARVAGEMHADILVVGSSHVGTAAGSIVGSFTAGLLRRSPCPVLVVRAMRSAIAVDKHDQKETVV